MNISDFYHYPFLQTALLAVVLLSLSTGLLSPIIISKGQAFMGASISHSSLLGISVGLALFDQVGLHNELELFFITLFITILLTLFLAHSTFRKSLPKDSAMGIFLAVTMGLGIIIHQQFAPKSSNLLSYLFGNILLLSNFDLILLGLLAVLIALIILIPRRQWLLFLIDEDASLVQGLPTARFHYGLLILLTIIIIAGVKVAGTVLINAFLLMPGLFALNISRGARGVFLWAPSFALITGVLGLILSNSLELPVGACIAVFQFISLVTANKILKKYYSSCTK